MAVGFEKMNPGSLASNFKDRVDPLSKTLDLTKEVVGVTPGPFAAQIFANGAEEYCQRYGATWTDVAAIGSSSRSVYRISLTSSALCSCEEPPTQRDESVLPVPQLHDDRASPRGQEGDRQAHSRHGLPYFRRRSMCYYRVGGFRSLARLGEPGDRDRWTRNGDRLTSPLRRPQPNRVDWRAFLVLLSQVLSLIYRFATGRHDPHRRQAGLHSSWCGAL